MERLYKVQSGSQSIIIKHVIAYSDCRTVGPRLVLTRVADVTFLQGRTVSPRRHPSEYGDPLSNPRQKKPVSRTVGPRSQVGKKCFRQFSDVDLQSVYQPTPSRAMSIANYTNCLHSLNDLAPI
ncbi:hypothetical protein J6590_059835 [Homalodisca vitripennis]|nr:hypothetical protein J6590_059835 [Homalodisca vitripennis]